MPNAVMSVTHADAEHRADDADDEQHAAGCAQIFT